MIQFISKINWTYTDYFNVEDWERINSNLQKIVDTLQSQFNMPTVELIDTSIDKGRLSLPTVSLINKLETNLTRVYEVFNVPISEWQASKTWYDRMSNLYRVNPNSDDWNRWEITPKRILESINYMSDYSNQRVLGTFYAGSNNLIQKFSRGR